ncbi:uncharacterized protein LOC111358056 [Spodoptera litura]|uniref:Uncharacterized protein LOC111358056 n=1 Tax=Spodoptera litura TaxID=69820 RepID=A0A9J7EIL9_SPOLT|nr:uncharacterized protein LOC111358056 [Spodoptera litura]
MVGQMMWFKRESKAAVDKGENGMVNKLRRKKPVILKATRESSERETSTESDKERRRYSDILDVVSIERRDESDESLYESADGHSDAISASDDALPRLSKTPTISKESLKVAVTDEEVDFGKTKKTHRKTMSLSNPIEIVKNLGDEWFESARRELDKNNDKKKSRESLWSEEDRDSIHGSSMKLDQIRKNSKKEDKNLANLRKISTVEAPKTRKTSKGSSVSALNFLRRKKTPTSTKPVESVAEDDKRIRLDEIMDRTKLFLESEKQFSAITASRPVRPVETDSEDEPPTPKMNEHRRRLSRQTSRSKSKVRGKSQSLKVNTLRKSHSGTLKKGKKKSVKTPSSGRSRQASIVEQTPIAKKKHSDSTKHNSWLFSGSRGESRREGSTDEPTAPDGDVDTSDANTKEPDKDNNWRSPATGGGRGVNRAESCRERDAPRRGKHRNASDPNRLTAHNNHDLEPGAATAPSGSSSSSSLSSRSNESNTVAAEQQASQSDWSEEEEPLAAQWADSLPPHVLDGLELSAALRKRQEVIHELIVSEGSHVRWLRVLGGVFLRPLERHAALLAADDLRALFPNLPAVRERHARLYADLRAARNDAGNHVVQIRPVADALLNTLGDSGYAQCVSKFCRGQRMALDALRERRRKSKELHQFLAAREQQPLCGRLQLKDMLACVWQRLTKYQLLLEGILKTAVEGEETEEDLARLRRAHDVAKDVLHRVDTAIRTAENEHRLRTIQSKLEIRVPSASEWDELRRLDLTQHRLTTEGDLTLRNDSSKRINVLALMLEDCLVLLQRESDKFVLKPIPLPSQSLMLSPLIKWDKVLFRPNAAVRNTFFLMNINGVQMHELSANSAPEYASWVKHIQEAPLAKLTELKATIPTQHAHSRSADDSGINVSRNPSDASEKSSSTAPGDEPVEPEKDRTSVERTSAEREDKRTDDEKRNTDVEDRSSTDKEAEVTEKEDKHKPRRPTVGRISTQAAGAGLEAPAAVTVRAPAAHTAQRVYTHAERLRRLDSVIAKALRAKSSIVGSVLGVPPQDYAQFADLAVADALGEVDVCGELRVSRGGISRSSSVEDDAPATDLHQLLLAAHAQAAQLTRCLQRALWVSEAGAVAARARPGRCDSCRHRELLPLQTESFEMISGPEELDIPTDGPAATPAAGPALPALGACDPVDAEVLEKEMSEALAEYELPPDGTGCEDNAEDALECGGSAPLLAARVLRVSAGLQTTLSRALAGLQPAAALRARQHAAALRDANDALRARAARPDHHTTEEISIPKAGLDPSIQDQPSNGG